MFLSSRRATIAACILAVLVISLVGAFQYNAARVFMMRGPSFESTNSSSLSIPVIEEHDWKPFWTTEQEEPKFAYAQYATNMDYLCNTIINFSRLRRFGAKKDLVLIYPKSWDDKTKMPTESAALKAIRREYPHLNLRAFDLLSTSRGDATWSDSLHKFHTFALTEWTRVLYFDSDSLVLNGMDHYFLAPLAAIAVPRAYWLNKPASQLKDQILGSHVMLLEPSTARYERIVAEARSSGDFDMEVINHLFKDSAMILPHRRLALLTGEFRATNHSRYLAPDVDEEWNAMGEVSRAYLVHFSDWPLPKPWRPRTEKQWNAALPACDPDEPEKDDRPKCADRVMWTGMYKDYDSDLNRYCGILRAQ